MLSQRQACRALWAWMWLHHHILQWKPNTPAAQCFLTLLHIFIETLKQHSRDSVIYSHGFREQQHCVQAGVSGRRFGFWELPTEQRFQPLIPFDQQEPSNFLNSSLFAPWSWSCYAHEQDALKLSVMARLAGRPAYLLRGHRQIRGNSPIGPESSHDDGRIINSYFFKGKTNYVHV